VRERFLTILRLYVAGADDASHITRYEVDSTGTTEMEKENSLKKTSATDQVELRLPVPPGGELSSETLRMPTLRFRSGGVLETASKATGRTWRMPGPSREIMPFI